ncbi:hypothetical protein JS756_21930 [Streptomyces actuosus]|uniref:Uncharacterized protein n=1 Tax=Streptomyces actuosus TaxID=1885 RepID=A0ABS2VUH7_STRAS|nr:hypothetical protein [Streptomyces actuosus]MBN0046718.1 hypothetical protein [Streptomyces actuosus]
MSGDPHGNGFVVPPMPSSPPPAPPDALRAVTVAVLNLTGLGLGYALLRRWLPAAGCWAATALLLLVALPADADGVPTAVPVVYGAVLAVAAVHGAVAGLRARLARPARVPLALLLGVLLLAVPVGGAVLYDGARAEALQQQLLDRLERADHVVAEAGRQPFTSAQADYRRALADYRELATGHPGSRAAHRVPDRMKTFYATVGAVYDRKDYCTAVAPLTYLRTVPQTMPERQLGALVRWPDDRLAVSLYECGAAGLAKGDADWPRRFGELLAAFPESAQAARVEPAVDGAVGRAEKALRGDEPCTAVRQLRDLATRVTALTAEQTQDGALAEDARRATGSADAGLYACGVDQYGDGDFEAAQGTMEDFAEKNPKDRNRARAQKIAIAAEIARTVPEAGKRLPTTASGGGIRVTVKNDSPHDITVLYTGPVTGRFTIEACGACRTYPLATTLGPAFEPCGDRGRTYPQRTISLPPGTTYFVHKPSSGATAAPGKDTAELTSGYIYTECAYTTEGFGTTA